MTANMNVQLKNSGINSGTAITVFTTDFNIGWKNLTDSKPIPAAYDIAEVDFVGYEGPIITVKGLLDLTNLSTYLTYAHLINFITRRTNDTYLKFTNNNYGLGGRPSTGYSSTADNTLDTTNGFKVQIKSFTIKGIKKNDDDEDRLDFSMTLIETA